MKIERREIIAAGGLAAFAAGFSQTLGRMVSNFTAAEEKKIAEGRHTHGHSAEPEYRVDPVSGEFTPNPDQQVSYTACLGCTTMCGVRVRVDTPSGRIIRVSGNPYSPLSTDSHLPMKTSVKESLVALSRFQDKGLAGRSTACGRGNAAMDQMNSPFRVLTPLKRVGPRNSGKWAPISFEQLVKEVVEGGDLFGEGHVEGLAALRDLATPIDPDAPELGPRVNQVGVLTSVNDGREAFSRRFWNKAYGTLNHVGHGSYCGGAYRSGSGALFGDLKGMPHGKPDLANAEFVLFIGTAPGNAGNPFKITGAKLAKGRTEGRLDYVVIDPVLNNSNNLAAGERGRWVPIRPGTDGALVMAIMRWMFDHDRVNTAYLASPNAVVAEAGGEPSFTNATWLVIAQDGHPRQGRFLRGSDIGMEVAEADRYKDADPFMVLGADGQPVPAHTASGPAPLEANGAMVTLGDAPVRLKTSFELLRESARKHEIAEYSEICGIAQEIIVGLAEEFTRHGRKASAVAHGGMMAGNGFYNAYSVVTLNALIGNFNWKGGFVMNGGGFKDAGAGPRYDLETFPGEVKPSGMPLGRNAPYERSAEFARRKAEGKAYPARDAWFPNAPGLGTEWLTAALRSYPYGLRALMWLWNDNVGGSRNALTGKRFAGCATWQPPAFFDGTPVREVHGEADWPLQIVSFKSPLQNSYSIATRITGLHPDNPVLVHPADAATLGLRTGDRARIQTPGGTAGCTVIVHEGVMRGVMAIEHGYGHREIGARAHRIGDRAQPERPDLRAGINLNDLGLSDPTRGKEAVWVDAVSGTSVRQGIPARLLRA